MENAPRLRGIFFLVIFLVHKVKLPYFSASSVQVHA